MQYFANKNIQKMSDNSLSISINSWNERIKEHENKIVNPENYYPEWNLFGERYKNGLIKHWEHEIKIFRKDIEEAQSELRKRGKNH